MNKAKPNRRSRLLTPDMRYRYSHVVLIYLFLIVFIVVMSFTNKYFVKVSNFYNILESAFPLMMAAFGQMIVMLTGGIDLSVGGKITLANCLSVYLMTAVPGPWGVALSIVTTITACMACGLVNGLFVTKGRLPPIIVTLATDIMFIGLALFLMPAPGGTVYKPFAKFLGSKQLGLPVCLYFIVLFAVLVRLLTNSTPFGKALRSIGGNESAAYSTGINVHKVKLLAYVLCGFFCALGGIYLSARMYSADPEIGAYFSMNSITAAVVGGTLMSGAVGDVLGTIAGVFIIFIINNVLNLMGVSSFYQYIAQGMVLILALVISSLESRRHQ